ncbi:MAG: small ribosomal subunit Rsm22 family protein [Bacteriovoracia bacterium]
MSFTLSQINPLLLHHFKSESDLIKAVEEISNKFTTNRESIGDYLKDSRLVSAYTAFYLLTNIPKLSEVMKWMPDEWFNDLKRCDFIDLGAGPGTFSLAWKEAGAEGDFYQIEQSPLMREQAKKLWQGLYPGPLHQSDQWEWETSRPKFLLFGHSANEMGPDVAIKYIEKINPDHILFIEPGTKSFFPDMLKIRDYLLGQNHQVIFPCPTQKACPMKGTSDWCHQFIQIKQDQEIERISQMARLDRKLLPLTVQAFSKTFKRNNPSERIVRVLPESKFSHEWEVCKNNELNHYQILKRDYSKKESKMLGGILAGEGIETEVIKTLENCQRVKFIKPVK